MLTQERLKEVLRYDPETGVFTRIRNGKKSGTPDTHGHIRTMVDGKYYSEHRLAFLYMTGAFPPHETDHINGIRSDNRWTNLRPATKTENMRNIGSFGRYKKGTFKIKNHFQARIRVNRVAIYLGSFKTEEEAHAAYVEAAKKYFGEFARME